MKSVEKAFERTMYASRWLLAPIFLGMSLAIVALALKFFQELFHVLPHVFEIAEANLVLSILGMIDMALVASLLVMVMLSSYENFVSRLDIGEGTEKLDWLGKLDAGSVKQKIAASIVAISSIHLLRIFMQGDSYDDKKLYAYMFLHLAFVLSAVAMGWLDKMNRHSH